MRISYWSSDVCSSDLAAANDDLIHRASLADARGRASGGGDCGAQGDVRWRPIAALFIIVTPDLIRDRKSVVSGKSVSVRVDLGGRRIIKKKITTRTITEDVQLMQTITLRINVL